MPDVPAPDSPVVLITGGHGGLATAAAAAFSAAGWRVLAPSHAELDVAAPESVRAWCAALDRVDALVNNAAITGEGLLARTSAAAWDAVLATCLRGAFLCARAVLPAMARRRSGHLIHIGSWVGRRGAPGLAAYAAAKAGLCGLSAAIAREYGGRNICSNVVLPGFLETRMTAPMAPEARDRVRAAHALGRFTTVEEAAAFVVHLAGMRHVSGQVFQIDSRIGPWT